jgi:hypothetical protein
LALFLHIPDGETNMDVLAQSMESYRVEVSGWDASDTFFVEKTTLEWGHEAHKTISLRSTLREGSVVFVRLLPSIGNENHFLIAYLAVQVEEKESTGRTRAGLVQLQPRGSCKEPALAFH